MWNVSSTCRICGESIPEDRRSAGVSACTCGWVDNSQFPEKWDRESSKRIASFGMMALIGLLPVVLYFAHWSGFGAEVLGIKMKSMLGGSSISDSLRMGEICEMLRKTDCAVESYTRAIRQHPKEQAGYVKLAHLYIEGKDLMGAVQVYQAFFMSGGQDPNLKFRMGNLLSDAGQYEMAARVYQELMDSDPSILNITVAKTYVQMLIRLGEYQNAKDVLSKFHNMGDNAKDYLQEELTQIDSGLKQMAPTSASKGKKI